MLQKSLSKFDEVAKLKTEINAERNWPDKGCERETANVNKQTRLGIVVVFCSRPTVKTVYTAAYCKRHLFLVVTQLLSRTNF